MYLGSISHETTLQGLAAVPRESHWYINSQLWPKDVGSIPNRYGLAEQDLDSVVESLKSSKGNSMRVIGVPECSFSSREQNVRHVPGERCVDTSRLRTHPEEEGVRPKYGGRKRTAWTRLYTPLLTLYSIGQKDYTSNKKCSRIVLMFAQYGTKRSRSSHLVR